MKKEVSDNTLKLARETMTGDLRDCLLDFLKHEKNPLPWNMRTEDAQREAIEKCSRAAMAAVERAVSIIAADGRPTILATCDQVTVKDGIKAVVSLSKSDALRHELVDSQGKTVLIVVTDADRYEGEREPAVPQPNQPDLSDGDGPVFDNTDAGKRDAA